jgi:molybdenum cofactor cytidylyltransferase/nicotine blue oxidoreductase
VSGLVGGPDAAGPRRPAGVAAPGIAAAVLAAGAGVRMGGPKADLVVGGVRLLDRAVAAARDAGCAPVVAVVRAGTSVSGARVVVNSDPSRGQRSSLELAVAAVPDAAALAVLLVDTPGLGADALRAVCRAWRPGRIAVGLYAGRRGHPVVMAPALWRTALALAGPDEGARALLATRPELVDEVDAPGDPADLDTPADLPPPPPTGPLPA